MRLRSRAQQLVDLKQAVGDFDHAGVGRLVLEFVQEIRTRAEPVDPEIGINILEVLQRKRYIGQVQDVAEALLAHGRDTVDVRHRYALALVDHDRTAAAEALLAAVPPAERDSNTEVQGAVGRVHKQRYVTSGPAAGPVRRDDLVAAVDAYARVYEADPVVDFYHGINTAALLKRAAADGVDLPGHPEPAREAEEIALAILRLVDGMEKPTIWHLASAAEACVALGRADDAVYWLARYVGSDADAFEYNSTLRQFQQVWRLDTDREPGRRLVPLLRNRLLQTAGGALTVDSRELTPESLRRFDDVQRTLEERGGTQYQRIFGWDQFQPVDWLRKAMVACRSVARVEDGDEGVGTGFVVDGRKLHDEWPERVLLTNSHVVPDTVQARDVSITFRRLSDAGPDEAEDTVTVSPVGGEMLWCSPKHEFDVCVLALPHDLSRQVRPLRVRREFPTLGPENRVRAYVIGHPHGLPEVQLSLHDSVVLGVDERYAWYRSPTESGSSGSPVFDNQWRVIAVHHGATDSMRGSLGGSTAANEGIRFDQLQAAVRS